MNLTLSNFSIVVLAQAHNPTVLNPDFLKNNHIVNEEWTPKIVICTPPVAQVVYEEGISIIAEFERLQFIDTVLERIPENSPVPNIATKYIQTLPHVRYIAAGINFDGHCLFSDSKSASAFISEKFIKAGPWLTTDQNADISITFAYPYNNKKKSISLRPGEISQSNGERLPGILVNANYHFGIAESELNLLESFVASWHDPYRDFEHFTMEVFGEE